MGGALAGSGLDGSGHQVSECESYVVLDLDLKARPAFRLTTAHRVAVPARGRAEPLPSRSLPGAFGTRHIETNSDSTMPCCHPHLTLIPRNLYAFAVCLEIPPVDTGACPIGAGQEPAVRQANHYVESVKVQIPRAFGVRTPVAAHLGLPDANRFSGDSGQAVGVRPGESPDAESRCVQVCSAVIKCQAVQPLTRLEAPRAA